MEWQEAGVVVGVRIHGETSVILEIFTAAHGRHVGIVPGGRSRRLRPVLQPGNIVLATWRARLEEQMGTFAVEPLRMRAGQAMQEAAALHALNHLSGLSRLLPERDPHPALHARLASLLEGLHAPAALAPHIVEFELALLADLGFGLDLECCAATGQRDDLAFVSPRTGRAVSRSAGEPYRDRILALPRFLTGETVTEIADAEIVTGFQLTEFFLRRDVFAPRGLPLPAARRAYLVKVFPDAT